jgi:hypothetical protein
MAYDAEKPIPQGYRVEERVRKGPLIAGAIVMGVPYAVGLQVAAADGFPNHSYWLIVPGIGPVLTMTTREDRCNGTRAEAGDCLGDAAINMLLVFDSLLQTTGAVLMAVGVFAKKKVLVREQATLYVGPRPVGSGYGAGVWGEL